MRCKRNTCLYKTKEPGNHITTCKLGNLGMRLGAWSHWIWANLTIIGEGKIIICFFSFYQSVFKPIYQMRLQINEEHISTSCT
jgi:hypothetical protein